MKGATTPDRPPEECGHEAARLLPWYVNGTLGRAEAMQVGAHLRGCARCRDDVARLEAIGTLLRAPAPVEHAPQAGLRKLMSRVDAQAAGEQAVSAAVDRRPGDATPPSRLPDGAAGDAAASASRGSRAWDATSTSRPSKPQAPPAARPHRARTLRSPVRWLAAAVVVQAVAIAALVGTGALRPEPMGEPAAYRTLGSSIPVGPRLRVVFVPSMTLAELQNLLRAHQLVAVGGPSEAGIFTLALASPSAGAQAQADAVARLRADARVRFAEAIAMEAAGR